MRFVAWRILRALLIAAVFAAVVIGVSSINVEEKHYEVTDADIDIELQRDGSLIVSEALTFSFSGNFTGAYRDIRLNGPARITDVTVSEDGDEYSPGGATGLGSFDRPGTFGTVEKVGSDYRVVWHYSAADEERTFDVVYRVVNATDVHDDVIDVTWTVWGDQWAFWLDHLDASISSREGVAPTEAWLRPRSLGVEPEITGDAATVSVDRLPQGELAGMRAVFPRDAIPSGSGTVAGADVALPQIEAEEAKLDDDYGTFDKLQNFANDNALILSLLIGGLGLIATFLIALMSRERRTEIPEYLPEPPEDIPPALAYALAKEGAYDDRLVLATLLDLVDRGYYEARASSGEDLDLEIRPATGDDRPPAEVLEKYEVATLDFFDRLLGTNWTALGKMSDRIPEHSSAWRSRWESLNEELDLAEEGQISWDRDMTGARAIVALVVTILLGAVAILAFMRTHHLEVPLIALVTTLLLIYALPGSYFKRVYPAARQRQAGWSAFEHWTRDFPRLDDDPPSTLKLWRRILVYAVAFDTAERVIQSGRIPAPVGEEAASTGLWTAYAVSPGFGHSFGGFSSGFASQVAPESSSSGGGGFSGGGGGGFSGGGGGGAW